MTPTIYRERAYRFFFNSNEESRMHVHVSCPDGQAKFWLEPNVTLATFRRIKEHQLREVQAIVEEHEEEFKNAWIKYFGQSNNEHRA